MEKILTEDPRMCDMDKIEGSEGSILSHVVKTWMGALAGCEGDKVGW